MNWFYIVITAHLLFAIVFITDKFILSKTALKPTVNSFYVGLMGIVALLLIPFGFAFMPFDQTVFSLLAGFLFVMATLLFYKSIATSEVSRVTPLVGGAVPIFTFMLSYGLLGERLNANQLIAFCLFVIGGVVMVWRRKGGTGSAASKRLSGKKLSFIISAAFCFASSFVITKYVFNYQPFLNGFIWMRVGGFLAACAILLWPGNYRKIFAVSKKVKKRTVGLFAANKILSALAFILQNYAIYLGSVTLVNALQGVQYAFLLVIALILSWKFPQILKEQMGRMSIVQKVIAILLISLGLGLIAF